MNPPDTWRTTARGSPFKLQELLATNGLPPLDEGDEELANFGELQYVSGILES